MHEFIVRSPLFDVLCKHVTVLVIENLLYSSSANQCIAVLVVTSFNAKLYMSLNIFKNTCSVIFELFHFLENQERSGFWGLTYFF